MRVESGSFVGPYRVLAAVGAGGMGEVYRARDEKLGRDVALKILSADHASSGEHLRRFEQEARAASALNHPNIIAIYDIGRSENGTAYIAMELVDGDDLRGLRAGNELALKQMLRIAVKVADGLAAAHERGIVHRDLKPENVMISRDGFVKILDFGLAKLATPLSESDTTVPHTTPGAVFGTVGYMSPEQAAGRPADFRSDQFALGVILYEMLTGRPPFNEATGAETLAAIIRKEPRPIENPAIPPELLRIVFRCLEKDPSDRYASTRDLARDLREVRDQNSRPSEPRHGSAPRRVVGRRAAWMGGVAAGVILLAVALVLFLGERTRKAVPQGSPTVAVVPFNDLSRTPEGQIFTAGLEEMITARLVQSRRVRVIPSSAGDDRTDPKKVARQKGAAFALSGTVLRTGGDLRLTFALVDARSAEQVGGETVTGATSDLFNLENRIVDRILAAMNIKGDAGEHASGSEISSPADQNAYVEALGLLQRARDEKSVDRAITLLEGLLRNARDSAAVNAQLARALLYKSQLSWRPGLIEQATIYAERAVEIDGSQPETHVRLGQLRSAAGHVDQAASEFRRALELRPDDPDAVLGLATTSEAMGRAAEAEQLYKKAIALRPNHGGTFNRYGAFLASNGRYGEAVENFRRFTEIDPTARGFSNLCGSYLALARYDDAATACDRSLALGPSADAYTNRGTVYYYSGRFAEASRTLERAVELAPSSYLAWIALGDAYRWSPAPADREKADEAYENTMKAAREAMSVNDNDAGVHAIAAIAKAKLGRSAEASAEVERALKLDPTRDSVLYAAAVVAQLRGTTDVAMAWLQRAVRAGYPVTNLQHDPEFKAARTDPAFPNPRPDNR